MGVVPYTHLFSLHLSPPPPLGISPLQGRYQDIGLDIGRGSVVKTQSMKTQDILLLYLNDMRPEDPWIIIEILLAYIDEAEVRQVVERCGRARS